MVQVVKSEWHQVEKRYSFEIDESILAEIYPDCTPDEIETKLDDIKSLRIDIDEIISDAYNEGVDLDWEWMDEDDWWTDRKGGYEVTYSWE
jgi:hypothetical protein